MAIQRPLGPQSVASVVPTQAQFRTAKRSVYEKKAFNAELVPGLLSQTYGPPGTKFADLTIGATIGDFFDSQELKAYEQYRFDSIELYAYNVNPDCNVRIMTALDFTDAAVDTWEQIRMRSNMSTAVLTIQNSMQMIAKWKPVPDYVEVSGPSPSNRVGKPGEWFSCEAFTQPFLGIKLHMEGAGVLTSEVDPKVGLLMRAHVTFKATV